MVGVVICMIWMKLKMNNVSVSVKRKFKRSLVILLSACKKFGKRIFRSWIWSLIRRITSLYFKGWCISLWCVFCLWCCVWLNLWSFCCLCLFLVILKLLIWSASVFIWRILIWWLFFAILIAKFIVLIKFWVNIWRILSSGWWCLILSIMKVKLIWIGSCYFDKLKKISTVGLKSAVGNF